MKQTATPPIGPAPAKPSAFTYRILIALCLLRLSPAGHAQTVRQVLDEVKRNNIDIQISEQQVKIQDGENRIRNNLSDPTIDYTAFWDSALPHTYGSELEIVQHFEFPTRYIGRHRQALVAAQASEATHRAVQNRILLEAQKICNELIYQRKRKIWLDRMSANLEEMDAHYDEMLSQGEANVLQTNKIKLERMKAQADAARLKDEHMATLQKLTLINGNRPIDCTDSTYAEDIVLPTDEVIRTALLQNNPDLEAAQATERVAQKDVDIEKQGWLPELGLGYRRNTMGRASDNGIVASLSIPLFSNRGKVNIARARALTASLELQKKQQEWNSRAEEYHRRFTQLQSVISAYDVPLMMHAHEMLHMALEGGEININDYFVQVRDIYTDYCEYLKIEFEYQQLLADLKINRL